MQTHFNNVFSFTQLLKTNSSLSTSIPIVVRFPDPQQPSKSYSTIVISPVGQQCFLKKSIKHVLHGNVQCHDYQTVEALYSRLSLQHTGAENKVDNVKQEQRLKTANLLIAGFPLSTTTTITVGIYNRSIIIIDIGLTEDYIRRACRLSNLSWARRMWALASRANLISFTSVYYSVLGGAYSSLSKANAHYAYKAGSLAIHQIKFAQWLKDPILESKCWLYYAEDLIQLHRFRRVDKIINRQVEFAQQLADPILLKMCDSVQTRRDRAYAEYTRTITTSTSI